MQLHISWILLVSSVSLSTAELPSDNDNEGNKKGWYIFWVFFKTDPSTLDKTRRDLHTFNGVAKKLI